MPHNLIEPHAIGIEIEFGSWCVIDKSTGNEWLTVEYLSGFGKYLFPLLVVDQVGVTGIHVHGGDQTSSARSLDVLAKPGPVDFGGRFQRQQDR